MQQLFLFLYRYRAFLTFVLLELLCAWFVIRNNRYQSAKYFNSSNSLASGLLSSSRSVSDYFNLTEVNTTLSEENARLRRQLEQYNQSLYELNVRQLRDDAVLGKWSYIPARVIKNSTRKIDNYITINKGLKHGVEPNMAVVGSEGVVGKVKNVSDNFSTIVSVLHANMLISSKLKRTNDLATTRWDGKSYTQVLLEYLPRHVDVQIGDTVVTSGYNAVFPEGIPIGIVEEVEIRDEALFHDVKVDLISDLNSVSYVYLIKNNLLQEQDSLENVTGY